MSDDLVRRLRHEQNLCAVIGDSVTADFMREAATAIEAKDAKIERLRTYLRTVQNAAKVIAAAHGTELEHLRQNNAFDHKLRAEHESLQARDAEMTDALLAAESRAELAERALAAAVEVLRPFAVEADVWPSNYNDDDELVEPFGDYSGELNVGALRAARQFVKEHGK